MFYNNKQLIIVYFVEQILKKLLAIIYIMIKLRKLRKYHFKQLFLVKLYKLTRRISDVEFFFC